MEAMPLQRTSMPNDEVKESNPNKSTNTMDVKEIKAETKRPNIKATILNEV